MTPSEEIKNMLIPILSSMRAHGSTEAEIIAYRNGFTTGAMWRNTYPHWISVKEELPKEHEWILGYSLKREHIDVYNFDSNGLIEAHDITHWMHLSPPPVLSNSENTGKDLEEIKGNQGKISPNEKGGKE